MKSLGSRKLARIWPYKRHRDFERQLRKAAAAWFASKGCKTHPKMSYCLDKHENWEHNIISEDVTKYIRQEQELCKGKDPFILHKYFHHGLSSQAMIFNLIAPLIVKKDFEPLKKTLANPGIAWPEGEVTAKFEYDDRDVFNEDCGQPTSIDLAIHNGKTGLFIEAKLVEKEFGGCSIFSDGDCEGQNPARIGFEHCYLHHIGRKYWQGMLEHDFVKSDLTDGPICPFVSYYQFFREVLFALWNKGNFVLLHDDRNPVFVKRSNGETRGLWPFLMRAVPEKYRANVGHITVQQIVAAIEETGRHSDWISDFKAKYGLA